MRIILNFTRTACQLFFRMRNKRQGSERHARRHYEFFWEDELLKKYSFTYILALLSVYKEIHYWQNAIE